MKLTSILRFCALLPFSLPVLLFFGLSFAFANTAVSQKPVADMIISGGQVATMDAARPLVESVAIKNGRILAVGSDLTIAKLSLIHI